MNSMEPIRLQSTDALVVVDVQNDFLPGGALAVPRGDEVIPVLNRYLALFERKQLPVIATRDWHPPNHNSFNEQGGIWPAHCVRDTPGASFASNLKLPDKAIIVSKATTARQEAYSGFEGTGLAQRLRDLGVRRVFVGGLATDYCVLNTVLDALKNGFETLLLLDACRAVNVKPDDGITAEKKMLQAGARPVMLEQLAAE